MDKKLLGLIILSVFLFIIAAFLGFMIYMQTANPVLHWGTSAFIPKVGWKWLLSKFKASLLAIYNNNLFKHPLPSDFHVKAR